jgi:hypothetical protein
MYTYLGHDRWKLNKRLDEVFTKCLGVNHVADRLVVGGEVPAGEDAWFLVHFMTKNIILLYDGKRCRRVVYENHVDHPRDKVMFADVGSEVVLEDEDLMVLKSVCNDFVKKKR